MRIFGLWMVLVGTGVLASSALSVDFPFGVPSSLVAGGALLSVIFVFSRPSGGILRYCLMSL